MSAPLRLTPPQLRDVANALDLLTKVRNDFGIAVGQYGSAGIEVLGTDANLDLGWDDTTGYFIDDRSGS
jgi:hypothetical protein